MTFKLHPATKIGTVSLNIRNMGRSLDYYVNRLGFRVREQHENIAYLGAGKEDLLILNEQPDAPPIEMMAGLYHFAILVPSRLALAKSLHRLIETQTPIDGHSDHLVSEAIYLSDPDGIGIEIYRDLPQETWEFDGKMIKMDVLPLNLEDILNELSPGDSDWNGLHQDTQIGHVHLNTGRNPEASKRFYIDQLGFDIMFSMGGYWHFVAAGGYHHHLGLRPANTRQNQDSIGLHWYSIDLPDQPALNYVIDHLQSKGINIEQNGNGYHLFDHAQNGIFIATSFRDISSATSL